MVSGRILKFQILFFFCFGLVSGEDDNSTAPFNGLVSGEDDNSTAPFNGLVSGEDDNSTVPFNGLVSGKELVEEGDNSTVPFNGFVSGKKLVEEGDNSTVPFNGFVSGEEVIEECDNSTAPFNVTVNPECSRDVGEIFRGLQSAEMWALQIVDSMEKIPSGLLMGRRLAFGQLEECLMVVHPNVSLKHCILEIGPKDQTLNMSRYVRGSALGRQKTGQFGYGICIPSSCGTEDFKSVVKFLGINEVATAEVVEESCITKLSPDIRTKDYFVMVLFSFLAILAAASTVYEVYTSDRKIDQVEILKSFSLQSNLKSLFGTSDKPQEIDSLYGIRFFSFTWLVLGHLYAGMAGTANVANPLKMVQVLTQKVHIVGANAFLCVDTYFFLSGFLLCLVFYRSIAKTGSFDFPVSLLHRYLRLTPSFAALILFNATLMSHVVGGPYAENALQEMQSDCSKNWWAYLLYIQNPKSKGKDNCFIAAWYLCADMQMYLVSPFILYCLLLKPKFGPFLLTALTLATTLASFISSYVEGVGPNPVFQYAWGYGPTYAYEYYLFITRMTPWLIGIATAYILCGIKDKKISFKPSRRWIIIGWLTAAIVSLSSLYGVGSFYPIWQSEKTRPFPTSSYRSLHRLGWALSLSWVILASVNNCGGIINKFLSYQAFKPLARLTYCSYLNHLSVQTYRQINSMRKLDNFATYEMIYFYLGDICLSLGIAVLMTLVIEMPFARIEKILLKNLVIFPYPRSKNGEMLNDSFTKDMDKEKNNVIKNDKTGWVVEEKKTTA